MYHFVLTHLYLFLLAIARIMIENVFHLLINMNEDPPKRREELMMWKQAMTDVAVKTLTNIERFNGRFPHVSEDGEHYELNNNNE